MTVRRWLDDPRALSSDLQRALSAEAAEPDAEQLRGLAEHLTRTLGVTLTPQPPLPTVEALATKVGVGTAASAAKPLVVIGAWVLGGVVFGAGLSGLAHLMLASASPAPQVSPRPAPARPAAAPPQLAPELLAPRAPEPFVDPASGGAPLRGNAAAASAATTLVPGESELALLRRAQHALSADPSLALALSRAHELQFEQGRLDQEREMIAIDALRRLGRLSEVRKRSELFRATYPSSAHLHRLAGLVDEISR